MFKVYKGDNDLYDGTIDDSFERKFALYLERCDQNFLNEESKLRGFSIMSTERANHLYLDKLRGQD